MARALRGFLIGPGVGAAAACILGAKHSNVELSPGSRFQGKNILITGGAGTFGIEGARYFVGEGANIILVDNNAKGLEAAIAKLNENMNAKTLAGNRIMSCVCDIRDPEAVARVVDSACTEFGDIDCLWNNAGYQGDMKPLLDYPVEDIKLVLDINVVGAFNVVLNATCCTQ